MADVGAPVSQQGKALQDSLPALLAAASTDPSARHQVIALLYPELKRIAEAHMRRERRDHTLQATALVSEFFVEVARNPSITARSRNQFLMLASVAMRRLLVDYARARNSGKRGGDRVRLDVDAVDLATDGGPVAVLEIDELLSQLQTADPRMAQIVELKFFGGLTSAEIADVLDVNERTVKRDWQMARAWLYSRMRRDVDGDRSSVGGR